MSLISISNLTFSYEGSFDNIFENVSFRIDTDWKLGFTGRNGRGKTTFLNLLLGKYEHRGTIAAGVNFEYFPFEVTDKSRGTLEIAQEIAGECPQWELLRELSVLEVAEDALYRPFSTLSNGEQTKVLLAALFLRENSFLLIDEPTNHLDRAARKLVSDYLNRKKGFILVSHDRTFLDSCVDHILSINKTNIEIQKGNFSSWWKNKQMQDEFELAENDRLKKDIGRLKSAARRTSQWADQVENKKIGFTPYETEKNIGRRPVCGAKSKKMMQRSKSIQNRQEAAIEEKSKLLKNIEETESLKLAPLEYHAKRLVSLEKIALFYGERKVADNISFSVEQGDRIAICGRNGAGKSSLLKLICGENISYEGILQRGSNLVISRVPQDASFLKGGLADFAEENGLDETLFKAILRKLDFSRAQFEKDMGDYSGGQKKKVLLAKSLCEKAHLYVWDEPLNYIDVFSRMQIERLLQSCRSTVVFVEHDRAFADAVATKTVFL